MDPPATPYRSPAAGEPPTVVDFRHLSPIWPAAVTALLAVAILATSHRVELHCERATDGTGSCKSRDVHILTQSESDRFDLAGVRRADIVRGAKGATRVVLRATRSTLDLSAGGESGMTAEKNAFVEQVNAFLAGRTAPTLDVAYGSSWANNLPAFLFILPMGLLFAAFTRRVRVIVDRAARRVTVERSRYPLAPAEESHELADVTGVVVEEQRGGKGGVTYRVALVLTGGLRVPLTRAFSSGQGSKEQTAARIRAALGGARDPEWLTPTS